MQRYTDLWTVTEGAIDVMLAEMGFDGNAALRACLLLVYTTLSAYAEVPVILPEWRRMIRAWWFCPMVRRGCWKRRLALLELPPALTGC